MLRLVVRGLSTSVATKPERVRRALFNGSDERKLAKATTLVADSLVFDLEDGVPMASKARARELVVRALADPALPAAAERAVRINCVGSSLEQDDLSAILPSTRLQAIVIPKVESAKHVHTVATLVDRLSPVPGEVRLIACIESALGLLNIREIAAADPRMDALVFASEDFCADLGMIRTDRRLELLYARSALVTTAVAYGLQAIDLVTINFKDMNVLREECLEGRQMGFTGKQAIHPGQIDVIQEMFAPSAKDVQYARDIITGFAKSCGKPFDLNGKMIDTPVAKWAQKILARAERINSK